MSQTEQPGFQAISAIVPLHNEEPNVQPLVREIVGSLGGLASTIEVILVDDASTDGTWAEIQRAREADGRVVGVRHARQRGQSAAMLTGFRASRGEVLVTLDGDLQNNPADLPRMLAALADCDMVAGVRTGRQDNWVRLFSSFVARKARKWVLGMDFRDSSCALRAFRRPVLDTVPPFNGLHRFMPLLAKGGGARVIEFPVSHRARTAGKSKYGVANRLFRGMYDLIGVGWFLKRQIPSFPPAGEPPPKSGPPKS